MSADIITTRVVLTPCNTVGSANAYIEQMGRFFSADLGMVRAVVSGYYDADQLNDRNRIRVCLFDRVSGTWAKEVISYGGQALSVRKQAEALAPEAILVTMANEVKRAVLSGQDEVLKLAEPDLTEAWDSLTRLFC